MAAVVVIYGHPTDAAAFEQYYAETHVPLLFQHQRQIGFHHADFLKLTGAAGGGRAPHYRIAQVWFESEEALRRGMATPEFSAVGGDLRNFATRGVTASVAVQTAER
jgi:uncharacterized protein (TIGR02118 family)